jgi:hypothetical protein
MPETTILLAEIVEVNFSVPEPVPLSGATNNVQNRFYSDSTDSDSIVDFDITPGCHAYKVQCHSGDLDKESERQSVTLICDFAIYEGGLGPATG